MPHLPSDVVISHLARFAPREAARLARASRGYWRACGRFAKGWWIDDGGLYRLLCTIVPDVWVRVDRNAVTDAIERVYVRNPQWTMDEALRQCLARILAPSVKYEVWRVHLTERVHPLYEPPPSAPMDRKVVAIAKRHHVPVACYLGPDGATRNYGIMGLADTREMDALGVNYWS
jgi:hypothetical protein